MPELPPCPNFIEGRCPRSEVCIEKEGETFWTFRCLTCKTINVFPKEKDESKGRYDAFLKKKLLAQEKQEHFRRKREYSK